MRRIVTLGVMTAMVLAGGAYGGVVVTLTATGPGGEPVSGSVPPGTTVAVDVLLSVDEADDPLTDVRLIQLDYSLTSDSIETSAFAWMLDSLVSDAQYVSFSSQDALQPSIAYVGSSGSEGLILNLSATPVRVATVDATVNGSGTLDALGSIGATSLSIASVEAGFDPRVTFSVLEGSLSGGTLVLSVDGGETMDSDGDGVADDVDVFPNDPDETSDTDGDGVGDQADAFPEDPNEDTDTDGDGVGDVADEFPNDPTQGGDGGGSDPGGNTGGTGSTLCGAGAAPAMLLLFLTMGFLRSRRGW